MELSLTSLKNAIDSLDKAIQISNIRPNDDLVIDAIIHRFENTYDTAAKFIKRYAKLTSEDPKSIDEITFKGLLRVALQIGLIDNFQRWVDYREQRGATSHAYDEEIAIKVYKTALVFITDAKKLLEVLEKRNDD